MDEFTYTCVGCGVLVTVQHKSAALRQKYCGQPCYWRSRRKERTKSGYRCRRVGADHPLSNGHHSIPEHRAVLWDRIGPGPHPCHHCSELVDWRVGDHSWEQGWDGALVGDHLDRDKTNNDPNNIVPSCQHCNIRNQNRIVTDDELYVGNGQGGRRRVTVRHCARPGCGAEFLAAPNASRKYCSLACHHATPRRNRAPNRVCQQCGVAFWALSGQKLIYCQRACYTAARRQTPASRA